MCIIEIIMSVNLCAELFELHQLYSKHFSQYQVNIECCLLCSKLRAFVALASTNYFLKETVRGGGADKHN